MYDLHGGTMTTIDDLQNEYTDLEFAIDIKTEEAIRTDVLLTFKYDYPESLASIELDTDEFTAVCPWTGLPDLGTLEISYVPNNVLIELKSLKYYLLSFRDVGIVQEHVANRILNDLVTLTNPRSMSLNLTYKTRGGINTAVKANFP
tara:strand:- start:151 stop:591 length:441 start_codon:yes stop_codon:yes gene_type:complete